MRCPDALASAAIRALYALLALTLGVAAGRLALLLVDPLCDGGRDPPANVTEILPEDVAMWALLSPEGLRSVGFRLDRSTASPWEPDIARPWASYVELPGSGVTIFAAEGRGRDRGSDPVYLAIGGDGGGGRREAVPLYEDGQGGERKGDVRREVDRLRPPDESLAGPNFVCIDNRTACFYCQCRTGLCLGCSDGRTARVGTTNVDGSIPPLLRDSGRVWVRGESSEHGVRSVWAVDTGTMAEEHIGTFRTIGDAMESDYWVRAMYENGDFVRPCRRPQLGVSFVAGGIAALGASAWARTRAPLPLLAYCGLTAVVYGAFAIVAIPTYEHADTWFLTETKWLIADNSDLRLLTLWLLLSGLCLIAAWCWKNFRPRAGRRKSPRIRTELMPALHIGVVAYFCGWWIYIIDMGMETTTVPLLSFCAGPLLGLGIASRSPLPTAISSCVSLVVYAETGYPGRVASWGLLLAACWQGCHHIRNFMPCLCPPVVESVLLWIGCTSHFFVAFDMSGHPMALFLLGNCPLLLIGLWTGHLLPLGLALVLLVVVFVSCVVTVSANLDVLFHHMTDVVEATLVVVLACTVAGVAGTGLCGMRSLFGDRSDLSARFRIQMQRRLQGWGGHHPHQRSLELDSFFEDGDEDHEL